MPSKKALKNAAALLGSVRSEAKTKAARKNAKLPRKRKATQKLCDQLNRQDAQKVEVRKPIVDQIKRRWLRIE